MTLKQSHARIITNATRTVLKSMLSVDQSTHAINLITAGALHLDTARLGRDLYEEMISGAFHPHTAFIETHQVTELACENVVCRSLVSSLDLCAASLYWMTHTVPVGPDKEASVEMWANRKDLKADLGSGLVPPLLAAWLRSLRGDIRWRLLSEWRNGSTHGWVRHDVTISMSGPYVPAMITVNGKRYDLRQLVNEMFNFTVDQFASFVRSVETGL
jgi:hypothetical protein